MTGVGYQFEQKTKKGNGMRWDESFPTRFRKISGEFSEIVKLHEENEQIITYCHENTESSRISFDRPKKDHIRNIVPKL